MSDLKKLELTEKDFDLLVEGLDALPEKGAAGEMFGDLLFSVLSKDDPISNEKIKNERNLERAEKERKKIDMKDDIKILQGKLLMLKRYLIQENALQQTYDIINHVQ
jgi:hypothetical protein